MQSAQSTAQPQLVFPRLIVFLILFMLDRLVQRFFYVILSAARRAKPKDLLDLIIISHTEKTK